MWSAYWRAIVADKRTALHSYSNAWHLWSCQSSLKLWLSLRFIAIFAARSAVSFQARNWSSVACGWPWKWFEILPWEGTSQPKTKRMLRTLKRTSAYQEKGKASTTHINTTNVWRIKGCDAATKFFGPKKIASIKRNFVDKHLHDTWGILLTSQSKPFAPPLVLSFVYERTRSSPRNELMMRGLDEYMYSTYPTYPLGN